MKVRTGTPTCEEVDAIVYEVHAALSEGHYALADALVDEGIHLSANPPSNLWILKGKVAAFQGQLALANQAFEIAWQLARDVGCPREIARSCFTLAQNAVDLGQIHQARRFHQLGRNAASSENSLGEPEILLKMVLSDPDWDFSSVDQLLSLYSSVKSTLERGELAFRIGVNLAGPDGLSWLTMAARGLMQGGNRYASMVCCEKVAVSLLAAECWSEAAEALQQARNIAVELCLSAFDERYSRQIARLRRSLSLLQVCGAAN